MQIVFHIGAHGTDSERLLVALRKNLARLSELEVSVPRPRLYRSLVSSEAQRLQGQPMTDEDRQAILAQILGQMKTDRVVLNHDRFMGDGLQTISDGKLYANAHETAWLRALFPDCQVDFAMAIRNPATWIPAMFSIYGAQLSFAEFLNKTDPRDLSWADMVQRILKANPGSKIILWCNEDLPLIWPEVLRQVADIEDDEVLDGDADILAEIMQPEGLTRYKEYLESQPPSSIAARREVTSAFLDKFVIDSEIEEEFDLPGWDARLIAKLTRTYESDLERLTQMQDVLFIRP